MTNNVFGGTLSLTQSINLESVRSPAPDSRCRWLPKFNVDFLVGRYICGKIFVKIRSALLEIWANVWKKCPVSQCWRICQKSWICRSSCGWLLKFNKFFLIQKYVHGRIFMKIEHPVSSFHAKLLTDRQTDKQTDKRRVVNNTEDPAN